MAWFDNEDSLKVLKDPITAKIIILSADVLQQGRILQLCNAQHTSPLIDLFVFTNILHPLPPLRFLPKQ